MSDRIKRHVLCLHMLCKAKPKIQRVVVQEADTDLVQCFSECAHNVLKGNVTLTTPQKTKLKRYRAHLHSLAKKQTPIKQKKKLLQTGGFLPALLAPLALSIFTPVLKNILQDGTL